MITYKPEEIFRQRKRNLKKAQAFLYYKITEE